MSKAHHPNDWKRIERNILLRADFRCECGSFYDCDGTHHRGRCPNIAGKRYVHNKRRIALRVVQIKRGSDWRANNLVALCLPCYLLWEASAPPEREEVEDGLFDYQA